MLYPLSYEGETSRIARTAGVLEILGQVNNIVRCALGPRCSEHPSIADCPPAAIAATHVLRKSGLIRLSPTESTAAAPA